MASVSMRVEGDPRQMDVAEALAALTALARLLAEWEDDSPRWRPVEVAISSLALVVEPASSDPSILERAKRESMQLRAGLQSFSERAVIPHDWSDTKARLLRKAGAHMNASAGITGLTLIVDESPAIHITPVMLDNAIAAVRIRTESYGSARGKLDIVNLRGRRPKINLLDESTGDDVRCVVPNDLVDHVTSHIGRIVEVEGLLHRDSEGRKVSIDVTDMQLVERPLPVPVSQLVGILGPDWTGGLDSVEWVRRQRD